VHQLFLSFPAGRAGTGLLLLRFSLSAAALTESCRWLMSVRDFHAVLGVLGIIASILVLIGFRTATGALLIAAVGAFAPIPASLYMIAIAGAVALLGAGAFSVDSRIFGRREIVIENPKPD
jgi:hypothetical protein